MIYLKNIREKQTVYIPRTEINSKVVAVKSYDEGYADGIIEGKKLQKIKLTSLTVSENGVYKREDGWNEVSVAVEGLRAKTQEKQLTVTKDNDVVLPDDGYVLSRVDVNAAQYGQNKRNEGYKDGYNDGKTEGYEDGKVEGYTEGREDGIQEGYSQGYADGKTAGGSITTKPLTVYPKWEDANLVGNIVYRPETYNTQAFSLVTVNVETLYSEGVEAGYTQGKTDGYNQGYNEGYEEGKESGSTTSKIKVFDYGVNIKGSTFTTIPEWMDFEGTTDFGEAFRNCEKLTVVNDIDTNSAISMRYMFWNCKSLETVNISAPNATTMESMFYDCTSLKNVTIKDSSKVVDMSEMFYGCTSIQTISRLDTGNNFFSGRMFEGCKNLTTLSQIIVTNLRDPYYMFYGCDNLVNFGGFLNLKFSLTSDGVLTSTPNLSYDSCINILNGLYDFTGNGEIPNSDQGKLKVHQNFLNLVGNQISIATSKGWTITA